MAVEAPLLERDSAQTNSSSSICQRCEHPLSAHCKGGVSHGDYKEEARMVPTAYRRRTVVCQTRHCNNPLCSCIDFVE